jgi:hypothetical protein
MLAPLLLSHLPRNAPRLHLIPLAICGAVFGLVWKCHWLLLHDFPDVLRNGHRTLVHVEGLSSNSDVADETTGKEGACITAVVVSGEGLRLLLTKVAEYLARAVRSATGKLVIPHQKSRVLAESRR